MPTAVAQQDTSTQVVQEERSGGLATIRLNRPDKLNALNPEMAKMLVQALLRASEDKTVHAVVITGAGRAFCAGGDLEVIREWRKNKNFRALQSFLNSGKEACLAIATMTKPVIAAVNGPAAGAGMSLSLACDLRIASEDAVFTQSFAQIGLYPDFGATFFLPRLVGLSLASELFYTAERLTAKEACQFGIVCRVETGDKFEQEVKALAESIALGPPLAYRDVKRTMVADQHEALSIALDEEIRLQTHCFLSEDCAEGIAAFFEKRKPNFRGH
jgi:2-(1,2-epoxy-1,2-dihydrophenyl)acetyl-CoA isomerase